MAPSPKFQFNDVVRFKKKYAFDDLDDDAKFRAVVLAAGGSELSMDGIYWMLVVKAGAEGDDELGTVLLMPGNMFEIDPAFERRVK